MIIHGDCLEKLKEMEAETVQCCVTSPPYWGLRDYGVSGQFGLEKTPEEYVEKLVAVFLEVRRTLRDDGTLWLNLGDSYARAGGTTDQSADKRSRSLAHLHEKQFRNCRPPSGLKPKDLVGIPWRVAFALQASGWYLRQDIIWSKPNPMPESVTDRCTKSHEYIFLLTKSPSYLFNQIIEPCVTLRSGKTGARSATPYTAAKCDRTNSGGYTRTREGKNKRSVWTVTTKSYKGAHFATFPLDLIEPCILAGSSAGDTVLDPFFGSGTVGLVASRNDRKWVGIELNSDYIEIARKRIESA